MVRWSRSVTVTPNVLLRSLPKIAWQARAKYAPCISNIHKRRTPMPNRKREEPVVRVTVGLDQSEHELLSRLASDAGVSLAWTLRRAAREFLKRQGKQRGGSAQVVVLGRKRRA
jgi:hypothetical protein